MVRVACKVCWIGMVTPCEIDWCFVHEEAILLTSSTPPPHPHFSPPSLLHLPSTYVLVAGQWASLGAQEQKEKERFLAAEQRASRGFMTQVSYIECPS